jgi:hypothetical protein
MDDYRKKLSRRLWALGVPAVLFAALNILLSLWFNRQRAGGIPDFIRGFHWGVMLGVAAVFLYSLVRYTRALRNGEALKKLYIAETDERALMIRQKAAAGGMSLNLMGLAAAAVIAGYFNTTVFFALLGAALFSGLTNIALKLYYRRRY